MREKMKKNIIIFVWFAFLVSTVLICAEIFQYSQNTLAANGRWVNSKNLMQVTPMGSYHFMLTRNALRGNHLNLGEWHGYNEVHFNQVFEPKSICGQFRLEDNAYLSVLFNRNESGYFGVRLSRNSKFKNILFHADRHNMFTMTKPLNSMDLSNNWHDFRLDFLNGQLTITVDGSKQGIFDIQALHEQFFGFRSGYRPATVDNIRVIDTSGSMILKENFRNENEYRHFLTIASVFVLGAFVFVLYILKKKTETVWSNTVKWLLSMQLVIFMITVVCFSFDFYFWSGRYYYGGYTPWGQVNRSFAVDCEKMRMKFFGTDFDRILAYKIVGQITPHPDLLRSLSKWNLKKKIIKHQMSKVVTIYSTPMLEPHFVLNSEVHNISPKSKKTIRVGFIGTSQTAGEGAENLTDTLVGKAHLALSSACPLGYTIESFDLAIHGSSSHKLLEMYKKYWIQAYLDVMVINLSNNDRNLGEFADNLHTFLQINASNGVRTILLLEANAPDRQGPFLYKKHQSVKTAAGEFKAPVYDLNSYLNSNDVYDSGFLWWDSVHLSSYGQDVAAQWLALKLQPTLMEIIKKSRKDFKLGKKRH